MDQTQCQLCVCVGYQNRKVHKSWYFYRVCVLYRNFWHYYLQYLAERKSQWDSPKILPRVHPFFQREYNYLTCIQSIVLLGLICVKNPCSVLGRAVAHPLSFSRPDSRRSGNAICQNHATFLPLRRRIYQSIIREINLAIYAARIPNRHFRKPQITWQKYAQNKMFLQEPQVGKKLS